MTNLRNLVVLVVASLPMLSVTARPQDGTAATDEAIPATTERKQPNIIVIISDDAGYGDFSCQGSKQIPTPRIDSIAARGIRFRQGYVTASVCSPSRAGLITGRYQQRFGHESNIPPRYSETNGLPLEERTMADELKASGYRTIALGKWHLGYAPAFHPLSRGFDDYFGFLQGARPYWSIEGTRLNRLLRDREPQTETFDYMTDELGRQAAAYIERNDQRPFFLYLAFNAVHTPMHAREEDEARFAEIEKKRRRKLAAMTVGLDRAVGLVLDKLKEKKIEDDTIVVFVNDNGGATNNASSNGPLRGRKGTPYEGGLRVPFLVQWPAVLPGGKVYDHPVSTLDLMPTFLAAAKAKRPVDAQPLDGTDLLPYLTDKRAERPHAQMFWRLFGNWAIRDGDWKLLKYGGRQKGLAAKTPRLFDLSRDPGEQQDLAASETERVDQMKAQYEAWASQLARPRWGRGGKNKKKN